MAGIFDIELVDHHQKKSSSDVSGIEEDYEYINIADVRCYT